MEHELKCLPEYFKHVKSGVKRFELRKNDRNFQVGDTILLREFDGDKYTGKLCRVVINYILPGPAFGLQEGYCIMSIL